MCCLKQIDLAPGLLNALRKLIDGEPEGDFVRATLDNDLMRL
jgi:hypothetical protein